MGLQLHAHATGRGNIRLGPPLFVRIAKAHPFFGSTGLRSDFFGVYNPFSPIPQSPERLLVKRPRLSFQRRPRNKDLWGRSEVIGGDSNESKECKMYLFA